MTNLPTKTDLRAETRDWLKRGAIPAVAAQARRQMAAQVPNLADWHNAFADEWDRIAAKFPEKVIKALEAKREYHLDCIATVERIGHLDNKPEEKAKHRRYHEDEAAKWDAEILKINPAYEPR